MRQAELDGIFATIQAGDLVKGWSSSHADAIDVLRRVDPGAMWIRLPPSGEWFEVPRIRIAENA